MCVCSSDYRYLKEHFRESHFLCEEGRCSTEQFTHAFRTEIDYKAHKAAAHSKNRAEARQNRQIDIQFNYVPRQQRRNDGELVGQSVSGPFYTVCNIGVKKASRYSGFSDFTVNKIKPAFCNQRCDVSERSISI